MTTLLQTLKSMTSGECRWIGRPDVHVYCHNPSRPVLLPDGRQGWRLDAAAARYCVVCPDAGLDHMPYDKWLSAKDAAAVIGTIA